MFDMKSLMDDLREVVGESDPSQPIPYYLKTSLPNINQAVSGPEGLGFPGGRLITIAGPESCGKTALVTEVMAACQRMGGFAHFEDFEHAFHHPHAKTLGLNCDDDSPNWFYKKPATAEEGIDIIYRLLRGIRASELGIKLPADEAAAADLLRKALAKKDLSKLIPICGVLDSQAAMITKEQDISFDKQNMKTKNMSLASFLSMELKRLARDCDNTGATQFTLNQLRENPGVMFGDKTTEPGGNASKYYASIRIRLRRVAKWHLEWEEANSPIIGDVVEMYVVKNKIARPFVKTRYVFRTLEPVGLDLAGTMLYLGKEAEVIGPKTGKTVVFEGKKTTVNKLWDDCQKDAALMKRLTDHVMSTVMPVKEATTEEKNAFLAADVDDDGGIPVKAPKLKK